MLGRHAQSTGCQGEEGNGAYSAVRKILLCYDGGRESLDALRQGGELFAALGAETHLLVVSSVFHKAAVYAPITEMQLTAEESVCQNILAEGLQWLRERGVAAIPHFELGVPIEVIPRVASELNVDLIVVGQVARSKIRRWWAGPENASLIDRVRCAVLVLRPNDAGK
jgi:nucleotide-binding universal stress UspA family protein